MEEDIKILEEYLKHIEKDPEKILKSDEIIKFIEWREIQALKKLVQAYKQDEKIIDLLIQYIDKTTYRENRNSNYNDDYHCDFEEMLKDNNCFCGCNEDCENCIKEYFRKKVENE